jgi:succinylglutamate desuccinylase
MKILLNILTHGDERIGIAVAKELQKLHIDKSILQIHIANKRAADRGKRFIDQDLNRSFPGKKDGNYEQRLAYDISPIVKSADIVLDIHSTKSELRDAIIVTKLDRNTRRCVQAIQPKYLLVMNATKHTSLISQAKVGIAFEYGKDADPRTLRKIVTDITRLLRYLGVVKHVSNQRARATQCFNVIAEVQKPPAYTLLKHVRNYRIIPKGKVFATNGSSTLTAKRNFYPILFGNTNYEHIFGFMAQKMSFRRSQPEKKRRARG